MYDPESTSVPVDTEVSPEITKAIRDITGDLFQRIEQTLANTPASQIPRSNPNEPKGYFVDPFALLDSVGMGYRANPTSVTYETLRQMTERDTLMGSIVNTRIHQVSTFCREQENKYSVGHLIRKRGVVNRNRRLTNGEKDRQRKITRYIENMGEDERLTRPGITNAMKKMVRDTLTYDQVNFENQNTRSGRLIQTLVHDPATIRIADQSKTNPRGIPLTTQEEKTRIMYAQIINGEIVQEFTARELAFEIRNPRSNVRVGGYGFPEPQILIQTVTAHIWAEEWNRKAFSQGSTIKGVLNMKGNIDRQKYEGFKRQWLAQIGGITNAWKTPILNSEGIEFVPMQMSNTEMGYQMWIDYLVKIACFTPEQRVRLADGKLRRIDQIEPGDVVRTHTGKARAVKNVQIKKVSEDIVNLRVGGRIIRATKEHPFYVVSSKIDGHMNRVFDEPDWTRADEIVEGTDYLVVPKPRDIKESVKRIDLAKHVECLVEGDTVRLDSNRTTAIPRFIDLTEDNAFVLGLYAAEGSATQYASTFSFNAKETAYGDAVKAFASKLGLSVYDATQKPTSLVLRINSGLLARAFKSLFGDKAKHRRIPTELRNSPIVIQQAFLAGLIAGDGWVSTSPRNAALSYATSSRRMCDQVQAMMLVAGVYASRYVQTRKSGFKPGSRMFDVRVHGKQLQKITWLRGEKADRLRVIIEESGGRLKQQVYETPSTYYVPVTETWTEKYKGEVYNLEVEDEHTYVVEDFAVHNCAIYQMDPSEINFDLRGGANQQPVFMSNNEGQQKLSKDRGLKPLLRFFEDTLNRNIIHRLDPEFEIAFVGLDAKTEAEAIELRQKQGMTHYRINELRALDDMDPIKGGDIIANPTYVSHLQMMEQMQGAQGAQGGGMPGMPGGDQGGDDEQQQQMQQPYQGRFGHAGDEQKPSGKDAANKLNAMAQGPKQQDQFEDDDDDAGVDIRLLKQNDWQSTVHASLSDNDLRKSVKRNEVAAIFYDIDL